MDYKLIDLIDVERAQKLLQSFSDAVRTALRKMLDQLDEIDRRRGRVQE